MAIAGLIIRMKSNTQGLKRGLNRIAWIQLLGFCYKKGWGKGEGGCAGHGDLALV